MTAFLRRQAPSMLRAHLKSWPFDPYDQGNPLVEIRQADLLALVDAVEQASSAIDGYLTWRCREPDRGKTTSERRRRAHLEEKEGPPHGGPSNPVHRPGSWVGGSALSRAHLLDLATVSVPPLAVARISRRARSDGDQRPTVRSRDQIKELDEAGYARGTGLVGREG
jgi:hypothetical protein